MRLPVALTAGTKELKTAKRLSKQSKGGRVRPETPHQTAPSGGAGRRAALGALRGLPHTPVGGTAADACEPPVGGWKSPNG